MLSLRLLFREMALNCLTVGWTDESGSLMHTLRCNGFFLGGLLLLQGCMTRGLLDPSRNLFAVSVEANASFGDNIDLARDKGEATRRGIAKGARNGFVGCLSLGQGLPNGGGMVLLLASPGCAVIGAASGGIGGHQRTLSAEDIAAWLEKLDVNTRQIELPAEFARLLRERLNDNPPMRSEERSPVIASVGIETHVALRLKVRQFGLVGVGVDPPVVLASVIDAMTAIGDKPLRSLTIRCSAARLPLRVWAAMEADALHAQTRALVDFIAVTLNAELLKPPRTRSFADFRNEMRVQINADRASLKCETQRLAPT